MKLMQKVIGVGMLCIALNACKKDPSIPTPTPTTVKDVDGNVYHIVKIGDKYWTVENAQMTHFRNKDSVIPQQTATSNWTSTINPAWCYYNNTSDTGIQRTYGKLYNWYTINHKGADGKPDFAPVGWHVPDTTEINALIVALGGTPKDGGDAIVGGKLKGTGTTYWNAPNDGANNSSGFTALPAGFRSSNGGTNDGFSGIRTSFYLWSSTDKSYTNSYHYSLINNSSKIQRDDSNIHGGYSVRFVKD